MRLLKVKLPNIKNNTIAPQRVLNANVEFLTKRHIPVMLVRKMREPLDKNERKHHQKVNAKFASRITDYLDGLPA